MVLQDYTPQHMLATLRTRLLVMYAQVDIALEEAARSYEKGEAVRAIAVCDGDTAIDALENEIDELCLRLMARIKPVAGDLRFVVAALRMVVDLERIGDEAVTVAEQTVLMEDVPGRRILTDEVCGMMQRAREAFMRAMDCFREGNGQEALACATARTRPCRTRCASCSACWSCCGRKKTNAPIPSWSCIPCWWCVP